MSGCMRKSDLGMRLVVEMQASSISPIQYINFLPSLLCHPRCCQCCWQYLTWATSLHSTCVPPPHAAAEVRTVCYHNLPLKYVHVQRMLAPLEGDGHLAVYPHSCLYPCRSGDKAHWRSCKCYYFAILLTHVVLLGYSSLVPKPLVQGYSC